jgi:hypothetical protein
VEFPYYGWPRITPELKKGGWQPNHTRPVYPNLARGPALSGINQLWVSDIIYIRRD